MATKYGNVTIQEEGSDSEFFEDRRSISNKANDFDDDDEEIIFADTSNPDEVLLPDNSTTNIKSGQNSDMTAKVPQSYDLVVTSNERKELSNFQSSINTGRTSGEDDSAVSFGDKVAQTIGAFKYAPSAPSFDDIMSDEAKDEYEEWLRCTALNERKTFHNHAKWEKNLRASGSHPDFEAVINPSDIPEDTLSLAFKNKVEAVIDGEFKSNNAPAIEHDVFVNGVHPDQSFSSFSVYVPRTFQRPNIADSDSDNKECDDREDPLQESELAWGKAHDPDYDEVTELVAASDSAYKVAWRNPTKNVIPDRTLWIVSDHNGESTGKSLEVWGPGCKPRFFAKSIKGKRKGRVGEPVDINTQYAHCPGRFTIVLIRPNELGFVLNLKSSKVKMMLPGRYFIQEHYENYIGKAPVTLGEATDVVKHAGSTSSAISAWAHRLRVVCVAAGHAAFCMSGTGVFVAPHRADPWIIDRSNDEEFISMTKLSNRVSSCVCQFLPSRPMYHIVNLQPDEFVLFRDQRANTVVYRYNPNNSRLNRLHLPSLLFHFDGRVHKITEGNMEIDDVIILKNNPQDFAVLQDPIGHKRFFEDFTEDIMVLRYPWKLLNPGTPKATGNYSIGKQGHCVSRVILTPAEWAVIQTRAGEVKMFPPMLVDGAPYYFYQPFHNLYGIANRFSKEEQTFNLPGHKLTIVNLATGELGACKIQNVNMFLNPRPMGPYVFVSPDEFLGKAPVDETHFQAGDIHYVRLNADERACVIRDGEAILLPSEENSLAKENKGNGVYIFRARQYLEVIGPRKKTEASYELGPWHFFNVPPGHVGYGTKAGKLHVWSEGQHQVNTSDNEQFSGFFQTNVDPVTAKDVEVLCKHAISSKLTITVTYMISDALNTIKCFGGDHPKLHRFVSSLATSKILELCAKRPPMGFSEADFDPSTLDKKKRSELSEEELATTDQAKVSGELLNTLRAHPEVLRAGIHIGFAEIQEWKIDESFIKSSKEIAMRLQSIHAVTERKRMELEQQKLDNARKNEQEKYAIEESRLVMERERVIAESEKQKAVILAQQEAETRKADYLSKVDASVAKKEAALKEKVLEAECEKELAKQIQEKELVVLEQEHQRAENQKRLSILESQKKAATQQAQAEADAASLLARKTAELKQQELAAQTAKSVALTKQEQQEIENQTNIKQAQAEAMMRSAAVTAERMAQAKAEQEASKLELAAAQTMFEANKIRAAAELELMKAKAQGEQLLAEAKVLARYPGLTPQERAQCMLQEQMMTTHREVAKRTTQVFHTMDPKESQRVYEQQVRNMMGLQRSVAGFMGGKHLDASNLAVMGGLMDIGLMNASATGKLDPFCQPKGDAAPAPATKEQSPSPQFEGRPLFEQEWSNMRTRDSSL